MKFISPLFFLVTTIFLVSCEGNTDYTWQITNSSSSDLKVFASSGFASNLLVDSVMIAQGSTKPIGVFSKLGGSRTEMLPENAFSALIVVHFDGDTMQSSYIDPGSWISEIEQVKKVPSQYEHTYTFVVEDSDF